MLTTNDKDVFERAYMLHNAGRLPEVGGRWEHATLGWNCRPTEYQAALLLHRFGQFERQQETRARNFKKLRELMRDVKCLEPLTEHPGMKKHGMYMFVLRYHAKHCGGISLEEFMRAAGAEGSPLYRCYAHTIADQPAMKNLREKHPDFIRVLPTPVSDKAAQEIIYISANVFLGTERDMEDIAAAVSKIEKHYPQ